MRCIAFWSSLPSPNPQSRLAAIFNKCAGGAGAAAAVDGGGSDGSSDLEYFLLEAGAACGLLDRRPAEGAKVGGVQCRWGWGVCGLAEVLSECVVPYTVSYACTSCVHVCASSLCIFWREATWRALCALEGSG